MKLLKIIAKQNKEDQPTSMRISYIVNVSLVIFIGTLVVACKDDDGQTLPAVTATGENTFGCLIDGKVYVPQGSYSQPLVDATFDHIVVYGGQRGVNINFAVQDTAKIEIFPNVAYYFDQQQVTCVYDVFNDQARCDYRETPVTGYIKFSRIDFMNHIISGVFEFTAYSSACGKVVDVTDGRFDIRTDM